MIQKQRQTCSYYVTLIGIDLMLGYCSGPMTLGVPMKRRLDKCDNSAKSILADRLANWTRVVHGAAEARAFSHGPAPLCSQIAV